MENLNGLKVAILVDNGFEQVELVEPRKALDQAGAYISKTGCSLAVYQQIYQQHRARLLKERRSPEHPEPNLRWARRAREPFAT